MKMHSFSEQAKNAITALFLSKERYVYMLNPIYNIYEHNTNLYGVLAQRYEHYLHTVEVTLSNPVRPIAKCCASHRFILTKVRRFLFTYGGIKSITIHTFRFSLTQTLVFHKILCFLHFFAKKS